MRVLVSGVPVHQDFLTASLRDGTTAPGSGHGDDTELAFVSSFLPFTEPQYGREHSLACIQMRSQRMCNVALVRAHSIFMRDLATRNPDLLVPCPVPFPCCGSALLRHHSQEGAHKSWLGLHLEA